MREVSEVYAVNNGSTTSRFSIRPLYLQVRDVIAQRIVDGEWKPHTAIPSGSELAREFGVSPGTIRKALDLAEAERLLTRRQGRGHVRQRSIVRRACGALRQHQGSRRPTHRWSGLRPQRFRDCHRRTRWRATPAASARTCLLHTACVVDRRQALHVGGHGHSR
jgi:DNA-binding transcriptional MocR family regulator